jgi:hypothetical protein
MLENEGERIICSAMLINCLGGHVENEKRGCARNGKRNVSSV